MKVISLVCPKNPHTRRKLRSVCTTKLRSVRMMALNIHGCALRKGSDVGSTFVSEMGVFGLPLWSSRGAPEYSSAACKTDACDISRDLISSCIAGNAFADAVATCKAAATAAAAAAAVRYTRRRIEHDDALSRRSVCKLEPRCRCFKELTMVRGRHRLYGAEGSRPQGTYGVGCSRSVC